MNTQTILVTGATGNVGRHIATQLRDAGVTVRALSRGPSSPRLPPGVAAVHGDLTNPDSLRNAAAGADTAFLLWPFLTARGAEAAVDAIAGQVRRIVYLSAMSVHDGAPPEENGVWGQVEQAIEHSAAEWTFLRASGFAANTLAWADQIRSGGVVRWAYGEAARSLIHERDIADVAVQALTDGKHAGATYVLTGPEAITQADGLLGQPDRPAGAGHSRREGDHRHPGPDLPGLGPGPRQRLPPAVTTRGRQPVRVLAPPAGPRRSAEAPSPGRAAGGPPGTGGRLRRAPRHRGDHGEQQAANRRLRDPRRRDRRPVPARGSLRREVRLRRDPYPGRHAGDHRENVPLHQIGRAHV